MNSSLILGLPYCNSWHDGYTCTAIRDGGASFVLGGGGGGGGGANKQAPATLACRGFWGISRPEKFEILKLGNDTFSILDEISKNK